MGKRDRGAAIGSPFLLLSLATVLAVAVIAWVWTSYLTTPRFHAGCLPDTDAGSASTESTAEFVVCATSDMAKVSLFGAIELEHPNFNLSNAKPISVTAVRNETIGFQLIVQRTGKASSTNVEANAIGSTETDPQSTNARLSIQTGPWHADDSAMAASDNAPITHYFAAHYHYVDKGGYRWGPDSQVLDWPAYYPDALVPNQGRCAASPTPIFDAIELNARQHANQSVWFDVYVPKTLQPGTYRQSIQLTFSTHDDDEPGGVIDVPIELQVHAATLPDKPSVHAVGEIYRAYGLEGIEGYVESPQWQQMSHCYQQLAHQHRAVFFERIVASPGEADWAPYLDTITPMLNGSLFSADNGYIGPGADTPVGVWRTPWEQEVNMQRTQKTDDAFLAKIESESSAWQSYVQSINAADTDYFAYIFDEVDGPDPGADPDERYAYIRSVHDDMGAMQNAIDAGSPSDPRIDLLWTSHSNPSIWAHDPALDLTGKVRLWAPNAKAADVEFLQERQASGDKIWFYHSGHPAIGVHSINASGIEMRTWGMAAARYGFDGTFKWAVNLGSDDRPFAEPSYKPDDDRFGNGVLVYPGNQLPKIGYPATPGPLPSIRLKAWRRGLQDFELIELVRASADAQTVAAMETRLISLFPKALSEGEGKSAWSNSPADWIDFRRSLLSDLHHTTDCSNE